MITVHPERVLLQALKEGFNLFRLKPQMLAVLFQNLTDPEFERVCEFIGKAPIGFTSLFPRATLTVPAVVLLLKAEQEELTFLGDHMGTAPLYGLPPQEHLYDTQKGHAASQSTVPDLGKKLVGPIVVDASNGRRIALDDLDFREWYREFVESHVTLGLPDLQVHVSSGTGRGQVATLLHLSPDYIDIEEDLEVSLDSTSRVDLREYNSTLLLEGEPARVYNEGDVVSRKGAYYGANYALEIISGSQEEVLYLYAVIRAILFLFKGSLEAQGIQNLVLSGSDFANRPQYIPDTAYMRTLNLSFSYPFSVIIPEEVMTQLEILLRAGTENVEVSFSTTPLGD